MRIIIVFLCLISICASARENTFEIQGKVSGKDQFKYAYAFNNQHKLIQRAEITDGQFLMKGSYDAYQRFGALAVAVILFSNSTSDGLAEDNDLSNRRHHICRVIMEEKISLSYDTDKKTFIVDGGPLNKVQDKFVGIYSSYRNRRDSAYLSLGGDEDAKTLKANRLFKAAVDEMVRVVVENPNSEVSLFNFSPIVYNRSTSAATVQETFNRLSSELRDSEYGIHVKVDIDNKLREEKQVDNPPYTIGMLLPFFELKDNEDKLIKSTTVFGKYTLVDFWATWCGPCRQETPNLIDAHSKFSNKGFKIVTVSIDDKLAHKKWLEALESDKMGKFINLFNGSDSSGLARELKIVAIPANFLVDSNGRIVAMNLRGEALQNKLKELMP